MIERTPNEIILEERRRHMHLWVQPTDIPPNELSDCLYSEEDILEMLRDIVVKKYYTDRIVIETEPYWVREELEKALAGCYMFRIVFCHTFENNLQLNAYKLKHPEHYRKFFEKVSETYLNEIYMGTLAESNTLYEGSKK